MSRRVLFQRGCHAGAPRFPASPLCFSFAPRDHKRRPLCACDIHARAPLARAAIGSSAAWRARDSRRTDPAHSSAPHPAHPRLWQAGHVGAPARSQAGRAQAVRPQAGDASFKRARVVRPRVVRARAARVRSVHVHCPRGAAAAPLSLGPSPPPAPHPIRTTGISRTLDPGPLAPGPLDPRERLPETQWNVVLCVRGWLVVVRVGYS